MPLAILLNCGKCTDIPYLQTFRCCTIAKTAATCTERKLGPCPEIPSPTLNTQSHLKGQLSYY